MIPQLGIPEASTLSVQETASVLPSMSSTITGWFRPLEMVRVRTTIVDRESQRVEEPYTCAGVIQPFGSRDLKIKPEGERSWGWFMLHVTPNVLLKNGEVFILAGVQYKVMSVLPYSDYGYRQYEVVQYYSNEQPR